jgi:hypothetical protein
MHLSVGLAHHDTKENGPEIRPAIPREPDGPCPQIDPQSFHRFNAIRIVLG